MAAPKVLVVEDDQETRAFYERFFEGAHRAEFRATIVPDGEQALAVLRTEPVDLAVLDWSLPGLSGASLAKAMRSDARTHGVGIIMVTGRSASGDVVQALESGADDHLAKPFDEGVLLARLRSLSRRSRLTFAQNQVRRYAGLELDLDALRLRLDRRTVSLTPRQMDLLKIFLQRPSIAHSREYLWDALWGYESDQWHHVLDSTISSLRRKLGPRWGSRLKTIRGQGYRFDPPPLR